MSAVTQAQKRPQMLQESTNRWLLPGRVTSPAKTCHTVRVLEGTICWFAKAGRVIIMNERYSGLLCPCCVRWAPTVGAVADRANNLCAPSLIRTCWSGRIDRRLTPRNAAAPPSTTKATASQQSMSCMKHLVEAERKFSVPSSKPKKMAKLRTATQMCSSSRGDSCGMNLDTNSVCLETHRIVQTTLLGDRTRAVTPGGEVGGWRGAVTSSSDQTRAETRKFPVGCQASKFSLQVNKGHTSRSVGSRVLRGKEKHISQGRGYLFVGLHAASTSISNHTIGVCGARCPQIRIWRKGKVESASFFLGGGVGREGRGGLETNRGRARFPGVVGRSKKVVMHWRRLNLNELNGELKSLGGFHASLSLFACWPTPRNEKKKTQPTNQPPPTNTSQPDQ